MNYTAERWLACWRCSCCRWYLSKGTDATGCPSPGADLCSPRRLYLLSQKTGLDKWVASRRRKHAIEGRERCVVRARPVADDPPS